MATTVATDVPHNATQLVELIGNTFGLDYHDEEPRVPAWKRKAVEAGKFNRAMKRKPALYTLENLALTVDYCVRNDVVITSPYGVVYQVERALAEARQAARAARPPARAASASLETVVQSAVDAEVTRADDRSDYWIGRLTRAVGPARGDVLAEWRAERDG